MSLPLSTTITKESDVIAIISSIGGGTGSGMSPLLLDILSRKFHEKHFILIEVYPPLRESVAAQQNAVDYLKEVEGIPNAVYMSYDNNKLADLPTSEMMKKVNAEIVEALRIIRGEYLYPTPFNSIDEKDMLKILETPGRLAIYGLYDIKEKDIDNRTLEDMVINIIKNESTNVELDRDKIVKRLGVVTNLNENLDSMFNTNLTGIKDLVGEPVESFEHVYMTTKGEDNKIILMLSGLSVPEDRIEKIVQRIDEAIDALSKTKDSAILNTINTETIKNLRDDTMQLSSEVDLEDILGKY